MLQTTETTIAALKTIFTQNCCLAVACALYSYERCLIFSQEVELVWQRRVSVATAIYVLMHASLIVTLSTSVVLLIVTGCNSGLVLVIIELVSATLFRWAVGAISALRVYAINGRRIATPLIIMFLFLVYTSYDVYSACSFYKLQVPRPVGCLIFSKARTDVQRGLKDTGLFCAVLAEILVLIPTWLATYRASRLYRDSSSVIRTPVSRLLLRDGTANFGIVVSVFVIDGILDIMNTDVSIEALTYVLQAICISHLYLNLRHAATVPDPAQTSSANIQDSYVSRVVGTLDGSLVFASESDAEGSTDRTDSTLSDHSIRFRHIEMPNLRLSSDHSGQSALEHTIPSIRVTA